MSTSSLVSARKAAEACELCAGREWRPLLEKAGYRYERCAGCSLVRAALDAFDPAALYDGLFESAWLEREIARTLEPRKQAHYRAQIRREIRRVARPRGAAIEVLDVGCGVGGFLVAARALGHRALGVEVSQVAARHAREALGLDVRTGSLELCASLGERFALVRANALLEHLPRPLEALHALRQAVAPGGVLFGLTLNLDSWTFERARERWRYLGMGGHVSFFDPRNLRALLERAGFREVAVRTQGYRDESRRMGRFREAFEGWRAGRIGKGHRLYFEARG
ncbi:MAG: class I SAM-dependent methyltransferase [Planctomycetes bacterium]|nr:class I SAM-dependent methyltransferase [Planctomycetota bacterium]